MKHKQISAKKILIALAFLLAGCGAQSTSLPLATITLIAPTKTLTSTPTPMPTPNPTITPTITPTPPGGKNGLLLYENFCEKDIVTEKFKCNQKIYTYDVTSHQVNLFLEGYSPAGVSPNGKKVLLQKTENGKTDLFIVDLATPEQIVLLYENADNSIWFPNTEWIGFISPVEDKRQVFIIHPDGSNVTQITNSSTGAVVLEPAFNNGVFWGEGTVSGKVIKGFKWTTLDGTETSYVNFHVVSPNGKFVITSPPNQDFACYGCKFDVIDVATGQKQEFSISGPKLKGFVFEKVQPLSDNKWVVRTYSDEPEKFIGSSNGTILLDFADLPHLHDVFPENAEMVDSYDLISAAGGDLSGQRLSPDGKLLMIEHQSYTKETFNGDVSYYVLNLSTFEIQQLPNLLFSRKDCTVADNGGLIGCVTDGFRVDRFFWIEMP